MSGPILLLVVLGCHEPEASAPSPPVEAAVEPTVTLSPEDAPSLEGCAGSVEELPASPSFEPSDPRLRAPSLVVAHKSARRLMVFEHGRRRACWPMGLGFSPRGHKRVEGDGRTPEGWYRTSDKPWSDFPGAIAIHYPNREDADVALRDGRLSEAEHGLVVESLGEDLVPPQQTPMGGEVLIHGGGGERDWTLGCMALDDEHLARLRASLPPDMRVPLLVLP